MSETLLRPLALDLKFFSGHPDMCSGGDPYVMCL